MSGRTGTIDPLADVSEAVDAKVRAWLRLGLPEFSRISPGKPIVPPLPVLSKGEFETTVAFQERVARAEQDRAEAIRALQRNYEREIREYDEAVGKFNVELQAEVEQRRKALPGMRTRFLSEAITERLGDPQIRELRYDADKRAFSGRLVAAGAPFERAITLPVPIDKAPLVKDQASAAKTVVEFRMNGPRLLMSKISVSVAGLSFDATMGEGKSAEPVTVATVRDIPLSVPDVPKVRPQTADIEALMQENRRHFASIASGIGTDPGLDDLRRREADVARRMQEAEQRLAVAAERERLLLSIRTQEEHLDRLEDGRTPATVKQWAFRPAAVADPTNVVAVIIGNRSYGSGIPKVRFAANDARAVRQFSETALRLPKENILFELDATKGTMEGIFKSRLPNLVERGKTTVLVYYSGHGIPAGDDARLMPTDSRPDTAKVSGYSRRELIEQLAQLGANQVLIVLDACFTGLSADGPLLASAKPIMVRPAGEAALGPNMVLVSASQADETSWADDESGMSMLTLHLLEGLSGSAGRIVDTQVLGAYLASTVDRHARREWNQPQHPQVIGENRVLVTY
ncbi:MAG: caspase family protein [Phaeospirillum sp.]|nr:caspase family protein [Phaeospirillum sp.]